MALSYKVKCFLIGILASLTASLMFYYASATNLPQKDLTEELHTSIYNHFGYNMTSSATHFLWGIEMGCRTSGIFLGTMTSGSLLQKVGPRRSVFIISPVLCIIGSLTITCSVCLKLNETIGLGLFALGWSHGNLTVAASVYLTEISPNSTRGAITSLASPFVEAGNLIGS